MGSHNPLTPEQREHKNVQARAKREVIQRLTPRIVAHFGPLSPTRCFGHIDSL